MNSIEIPDINEKIVYPSSWDECSTKEVLFIFKQALKMLSGDISKLDFQLYVFYELSGMRLHHPRYADRYLTEEQRIQKYENIWRCCQTIDFMFSKESQNVFEYTNLQNQVPFIRVGLKKWFSPAPALVDLTFGEYRMISDLYRIYASTHDLEAVKQMIAVLYRPKSGRYGQRSVFIQEECVKRSKRLKNVPVEVIFYITSWFSCCDNYLKTSDIQIEGRFVNLSCLFKKSDESEKEENETGDGNLGMLGIQLALAEAGPFGDIEGVDKTNLYTVLLKLYQWKKDNDEIKKRYGQKSKD